MKTILVDLQGTKQDVSVLATALQVARLFGAHLDCVYVMPDAAALLPPAGAVEMDTAALIAGSLEVLQRQAADMGAQARKTFKEFVRTHDIPDAQPAAGVSAAFRELSGDPREKLVAQSRLHDLTVMEGGAQDDALLRTNLGDMIVSSGKPVVLAPSQAPATPFSKIAVAWKDCPEAARAIVAAMPILKRAHRIVILTANEDVKHPCACLDSYESVANSLRVHGAHVECHYVLPAGRSVPDAILESARAIGADLLVMGAYGHSRLREFVFGGFTQRVLHGTEIPVFLFH
jgi:nucleotide-binding universal stress UspA family protein